MNELNHVPVVRLSHTMQVGSGPYPHVGGGQEAGGGGEGRRLGGTGRYLVNDGALHSLDGDRGLIDPQHTTALARGRAHPACELREVVGLQQAVQGLLPAALVNQIIPLRYQVPQWTTCSIHTLSRLRDPAGGGGAA